MGRLPERANTKLAASRDREPIHLVRQRAPIDHAFALGSPDNASRTPAENHCGSRPVGARQRRAVAAGASCTHAHAPAIRARIAYDARWMRGGGIEGGVAHTLIA